MKRNLLLVKTRRSFHISLLLAMKVNIRLIYLYLFSFVGLLVMVIGSVRLLELGLKVIVFKGADSFEYVGPKD